MAELKSLQDFYNPTLAMSALNYQTNQQHLVLQQQQVEQQGRNQEIDNLRQAAALAIKENPMAAPSAYNAWAERVGMAPITDPAAFIANPKPFYEQLRYQPGSPEHEQASQSILGMGETQRARSKDEFERQMLLEGNTKLSVASGGPSDPASGFALSQSKPGQEEAYKRIFDPARQAKVVMNQDYMNKRAGIHAELDPLLSVHMQATDALSNLEPIAAQLPPLLAQRDKDIATLGRNKAMGKYHEMLKSSPEVAEYIERAKASLPQIEQQIQEIQTMRSESLLKAQKIAAGTRPATENDNIHALVGQANAQALHLQYLKAQKALAKDPTNPANIAAVQQIAQAMNARIEQLHTTKTMLDVSRDPQQEQARKDLVSERLTAATNEGTRLFGALPTAQQTPQSAARIASDLKARYGIDVSNDDILKGAKLANTPLVNLKVDTMVPASVEAQKEFMKSTRTTYDQLKSAPALLNNIAKAKELIPQAKGFMGPGGETLLEAAKFLNNRIGMNISTAGIKSAEELRSRIFFNIMDNLKKMDAQPSQMQQQIMQESLGKLGTDPNALVGVLDAYEDTIRDKVEAHNTEVEGAADVKFPYNPRIKLPARARRAGAAESPATSGTVAPFDDAEKERRYQEWKSKHQ